MRVVWGRVEVRGEGEATRVDFFLNTLVGTNMDIDMVVAILIQSTTLGYSKKEQRFKYIME